MKQSAWAGPRPKAPRSARPGEMTRGHCTRPSSRVLCHCPGAPAGEITGPPKPRACQGAARTHPVGLQQVQEEVQLLHHVVLFLFALENERGSNEAKPTQDGDPAGEHTPRLALPHKHQRALQNRRLPHSPRPPSREDTEPSSVTRTRASAPKATCPLVLAVRDLPVFRSNISPTRTPVAASSSAGTAGSQVSA